VGALGRLIRWLVGGSPGPSGSASEQPTGDDEHADGSAEASDDPVVMPIEASIDLHHFMPRDIPSVVDEYLREARAKGFDEVRVIHGRGKGVQRRRVQLQLERHPAVASFRSDGLGSTIVALRPKRDRRATTPEH
jgi:dsDNA-specific endonuclease/ATPase MutS2